MMRYFFRLTYTGDRSRVRSLYWHVDVPEDPSGTPASRADAAELARIRLAHAKGLDPDSIEVEFMSEEKI